jgi:hypothetical protein
MKISTIFFIYTKNIKVLIGLIDEIIVLCNSLINEGIANSMIELTSHNDLLVDTAFYKFRISFAHYEKKIIELNF